MIAADHIDPHAAALRGCGTGATFAADSSVDFAMSALNGGEYRNHPGQGSA